MLLNDLLSSIDPHDIIYIFVGLALLGLTLRPALKDRVWFNVPVIYISLGVVSALIAVPYINPLANEANNLIIVHASELIVIISLIGAGLAIDVKGSWKNWQPAYRLLLISMPLTLLSITLMGLTLLDLTLASALLLAACIAPTDPVLARSVQVGAPGEEEEPTKVALTAEAGLNDGLAFPFVYLALTMAAVQTDGLDVSQSLWSWLGFDFFYRLGIAAVLGYFCGLMLSKFAYSDLGDARQKAKNSLPMVIGATFMTYGLVEALDGYGFLAVFMSARAGRHNAEGNDLANYERSVHDAAGQIESLLLAVLLLWFGAFIGSDIWQFWTWMDLFAALLIILIVRPVTGLLSLVGYHCHESDRWRIAFFGIRGMGSIFYLAYAQNSHEFTDINRLWSITSMVIIMSVILHGFSARHVEWKTESEG